MLSVTISGLHFSPLCQGYGSVACYFYKRVPITIYSDEGSWFCCSDCSMFETVFENNTTSEVVLNNTTSEVVFNNTTSEVVLLSNL